MTTKIKKLSPEAANKLALEQQVVYVRMLEMSLGYTYNGKSYMLGKEVQGHHLVQAKNRLKELDRQQQAYSKLNDLPYYNTSTSNVQKTKVHYSSSGAVKFVEAKDGSHSESVQTHVGSKKVLRKQFSIINKQKQVPATSEATQMATATKKSAKKTAKKATAKKAKATKHVHKGTATAQDMRDAYDKNPKTFSSSEYAKKHDVAYGRVYGAIVKHVGGIDNVGKAAPKQKAAPVKKATAKKAAKKKASA